MANKSDWKTLKMGRNCVRLDGQSQSQNHAMELSTEYPENQACRVQTSCLTSLAWQLGQLDVITCADDVKMASTESLLLWVVGS